MTENNNALVETLKGSVCIVFAEGIVQHAWQRGALLGIALYSAISALRHLLLAYKDGSIDDGGKS